METLRFIDGDAHVLEPEGIWQEYLEKKYQHLIKGHVRWVRDTGSIPSDAGKENSLKFEL